MFWKHEADVDGLVWTPMSADELEKSASPDIDVASALVSIVGGEGGLEISAHNGRYNRRC